MKLPQTHSLTERCEEGRCQATRLFRASLQDIFKLLRMRHKERILFSHRSDFLFDLGNQPFLGLAPTETVAKFLAEQGFFLVRGKGIIDLRKRRAIRVFGFSGQATVGHNAADGFFKRNTSALKKRNDVVVTLTHLASV